MPNTNKFNSLIIDSGSTVNIIANESMVYDIPTASSPLRVQTINGNIVIERRAYLGDYPNPVWFHPRDGVNIMSLNNVQDSYRCIMDTHRANSINIHLLDDSVLKF